MRKFLFSPDKHVGFERRNGRLVPLHDEAAIGAMLAFAREFKPDIWIEGGDNLDCGPVSHWLSDRKLSLESLDLSRDTETYQRLVLDPVSKLKSVTERYWLVGNHEAWLDQLAEKHPGLRSVLDIERLLPLQDWTVVPQGAHVKLGKLYFIHGDTLKGGKTVAEQAVVRYEHNIRFGHFHTYQVATKHSAVDATHIKTGVAVPGLCRRNPQYGKGAPNQWVQGFCWGYLHDDGTFHDTVSVFTKGRVCIHGQVYA